MMPLRAAILVAFATTVLPAQQAPLSNEWNRYLPAWLQLGGEYRARLEGYAGGGFKNDNSDDYLLSRLRLNLNIQPEDWFQIRLQAQDARALWKTLPAPPYQDTMDLRMAYLELGNAEKKGIALRAGRQEINFGDQRLVGSSNYTNNARTFDAVRLTLRHGGYRLDTFASTVVQAVDGEFDRPFRTRADNLYGLYGGMERLVPKAVLEPYVLWRVTRNLKTEAGKPGNRDFKTYGLRWVGKLPLHFDYNTEMAAQAGSLGADRIRAWAGHWQFGYTRAAAAWKPRLVAEYNFASGDKNPHDGTRGTFDQLYPTAHDKYGLADQVCVAYDTNLGCQICNWERRCHYCRGDGLDGGHAFRLRNRDGVQRAI